MTSSTQIRCPCFMPVTNCWHRDCSSEHPGHTKREALPSDPRIACGELGGLAATFMVFSGGVVPVAKLGSRRRSR